MLPIKIAGMGHYLPEQVVTSIEIEQQLGLEAGWIERVAGVRERRYATRETSAGMAAVAAMRALEQAGLEVGELDLIVGASAGPQQAIPCTAAFVQRELGAPEGRSACFDVNATCLSFLFALQAVAHLIAAGAYKTALICSSEVNRRSLNFQQPASAVLFGDAAAAAIITRAAPGECAALHHAAFATHSSGAEHTRILGGGSLHHPNDPTTTPEMNMFAMDGRAVFRQAGRLIGPFLDDFFTTLGWDRAELELVVPHQASRHAVELLFTRLGFREEQVFLNLDVRGNCVGASVPLALSEAIAAGRLRRGERVLLVGTGAGLSLGALAFTF